MKNLIFEIIITFKKSLKKSIILELFYRIFVPTLALFLLGKLLNIFLRLSGEAVIISGEGIKSFILTPYGISIAVLTILVVTVITLFEIGGLIIYSSTNANSNVIMKHFKKIFQPGIILGIIFCVLVLPFLQLGIGSAILPAIKIPGFIMSTVSINPYYMSLYLLFGGSLLILLAKYIFVFHYIIIENKNFKEAFQKSAQITKKKRIKIVFGLIFIQTVITILSYFISQTRYILSLVLIYLPNLGNLGNLLISFLILAIELILSVVLFTMTLPITIATISVLFKKWNNIPEKFEYEIKKQSKKQIFIVSLIISTSIIIIFSGVFSTISTFNDPPTITVHRGGGNYAVQNSAKALEYGISTKSERVEIDIKMTLDGVLVLSHDSNIFNSSGVNKNIEDITYEELKNYKNSGEPFLLFSDSLKIIKGKIKMNAEIKLDKFGEKTVDINTNLTKRQREMMQKIVEIIVLEKMEQDVVISSFNYDTLLNIKLLNNDIKVGLISNAIFGDIGYLNVDFYSVEETFLTANFVRQAHFQGREVHVWTINTKESFDNVFNKDVDSIITDEPIQMGKNILENK